MASYSSIVRKVMHDHDRHIIHSSVLKDGRRRVKCFAWRGCQEATDHLIAVIRQTLEDAGCSEFKIRIKNNYPDDSIIVVVPPD